MKTVLGVSQFFKNNTPKIAQIIGDVSLLIAFVNSMILIVPELMLQAGATDFVMPPIVAKINVWCMIIGSIIKFVSKFFGIKLPETPDAK